MPAFEVWLTTDPSNNPDTSPTPFTMAEFQASGEEEAERLEAEAGRTFDAGPAANQQTYEWNLAYCSDCHPQV